MTHNNKVLGKNKQLENDDHIIIDYVLAWKTSAEN